MKQRKSVCRFCGHKTKHHLFVKHLMKYHLEDIELVTDEHGDVSQAKLERYERIGKEEIKCGVCGMKMQRRRLQWHKIREHGIHRSQAQCLQLSNRSDFVAGALSEGPEFSKKFKESSRLFVQGGGYGLGKNRRH